MTDYFKKQMEHELTKGYYDTLVKIIKECKPKTVLEIGTGWGISGSAFLENGVERLITVDATTDPDYYHTAQDEIDTHKKQGQVVDYNRMKSSEFFSENEDTFDMIFIDGDHGYKGCKEDLVASLQFLNSGGVIVMDDFLHKGNYIEGNECRVNQAAREVLLANDLSAIIMPHNLQNGFLIIPYEKNKSF
jgi:predicted O-methyltransferase YrrM